MKSNIEIKTSNSKLTQHKTVMETVPNLGIYEGQFYHSNNGMEDLHPGCKTNAAFIETEDKQCLARHQKSIAGTRPIEKGTRPIEKGTRPMEKGIRPMEKGIRPMEKGIRPMEKGTNPILWTQILGAVISASVHLSIGVSLGFTGVTLPSMMDPESEDITLTIFEASIFSSIVNVGAILGSFLSSFLMVWLGQRSTLLLFLPVGMSSWIILGLSTSFELLVFARVLQGLVIGVSAGCANNYVVEFAHASIRGRLSGAINLSLQVGFLFVYLIGSTAMSWRNVGFLCGLPTLIIPFVGMIFLPHSPRWLANRGRYQEAKSALTFYRGLNFDVEPEINDIIQQSKETTGNSTVKSQFKSLQERSILKRFIILAVLLFASQFTGEFATVTYSVSIFQSANVSINSYLSTIVASIPRIIGVGVYLILSDKFGRRPLFLIPLFLSGVCMALLGLFFYLKLVMDDVSSIFWLPLTSLVFFNLFTCISHPVLMLLRSELLPTSVRAFGVGLLYFIFFGSTFCVALTYPFMVTSIGSHWTFWIYGSISFSMVVIAAIFIPETKGKTLEEIGDAFRKKQSISL